VANVEEKFHGLLGLDCRNLPGLDPLYELVKGYKKVCVTPGRFPEWADQIESPDREWPCDGDCLECLSRQVGLPSVILAPFAGAHDPLGVDDRCRPVKSLAESVPNQGSQRGMALADPAVDVLQQLDTLLDQNAAL
jgi:hypothetical protein